MLSKTRITRRGAIAAVVVLAFGLATHTVHAEDEFELGGLGGIHIFSTNNELGTADFDDALSPENSFILGLRLGYAVHPMFSIESEVGFLPGKVRDTDSELLAVAARLHGLVHFFPIKAKLRPFALLGGGFMYGKASEEGVFVGEMDDDDTDLMFHAGAGVKYRMGESWGVRLDLRLLLPPSSDSDSVALDFEGLIGLYTTFPQKSVPPPPKDSDGDGLVDNQDKCPQEAEDKDGFQDDDGCPDNDNDGDGVADDSDQCALEAEDKDEFQDEDGCPDGDNDNDGVGDADDRCRNEAEDKDGFQDEDGCPDNDNDGDGVPDASDKCPTEVETKNGYEDDDGCPDTIPKQVKRFTGVIRGITFEVNQAIIRAASYRKLDQAVKVLQEFPKLRLEISGHTDNRGKAGYNRELSLKRAQAVKDYLSSKGVDASRLEVKGYGPDQPIATNKNAAGRARNRRVEFKLLSSLIQGVEESPQTGPEKTQPGAEKDQ